MRRLVNRINRGYKNSNSKESFRTTVSKAILRELRKDKEFLDGFRWKAYGISHFGPIPQIRGADMFDPHNHHRIYKVGKVGEQQPLVIVGQDLLWEAGIDPLFGRECLGFAPNKVEGQHTTDELAENVDNLRSLKDGGADYGDYVDLLNQIGKEAANRR